MKYLIVLCLIICFSMNIEAKPKGKLQVACYSYLEENNRSWSADYSIVPDKIAKEIRKIAKTKFRSKNTVNGRQEFPNAFLYVIDNNSTYNFLVIESWQYVVFNLQDGKLVKLSKELSAYLKKIRKEK